MYSSSYIPKLDYAGDQVIIGSGRLLFHAKDDSAFIFASKAISLSTSGSTHINSTEGVFINGGTIELGLNAQEQLLKGNMTVLSLKRLYTSLERLAVALGALSETQLANSIVEINTAAINLNSTAKQLREQADDLLSNTTKTL